MPDFEIHALDLNFMGAPRAIAAYLIRGPGGPVLIETGPGSTLPALQAGLAAHNLKPVDVADVLVTHIHLDHAGAAGWWARQGARVHVHAFGAPHLARPEKLLASAQRIYGEQMETLWGELLSAPGEQLRPVRDGDVIEAGGLQILAHDTPGHARHHLVYQIDDFGIVGDLAGVYRPGIDYLRLPTPPPEFELEAWQGSVERMRQLKLRRIFRTHFGAIDGAEAVDEHWRRVVALLPEYAEQVRACILAGADRDATLDDFRAWEAQRLELAGVDQSQWSTYDFLGPMTMNVDGLLRFWQRRTPGG